MASEQDVRAKDDPSPPLSRPLPQLSRKSMIAFETLDILPDFGRIDRVGLALLIHGSSGLLFLNLAKIDRRNLRVRTVDNLANLFESWSLGLNVEEVNNCKLCLGILACQFVEGGSNWEFRTERDPADVNNVEIVRFAFPELETLGVGLVADCKGCLYAEVHDHKTLRAEGVRQNFNGIGDQ